MSPTEFKKVYSRDTAMIIEEGWFDAQTNGLFAFIGKKNPYYPVNIFCVEDGVLEIWENAKAIDWNKAELLAIANANAERILAALSRYRELARELEVLWKTEVRTIKDIRKCIELYSDALQLFTVLYFLTIQDETPRTLRERLLEWRARDDLMDGSDRFLRQAGKRLSLPLARYAVCILRRELEDASPDFTRILSERMKSWVVIPGELEFQGGKEEFNANYPQYKLLLDSDIVEDRKEVKGTIAFAGKVRGRVRVLRRKDQLSSIEAGDIIVSPMTIPDFLPAMKKAAAFVTDEGGITCHAAIVARELRKPCIIGTKIATKVLKDGDVVEVDAERGIVTVLERAKKS